MTTIDSIIDQRLNLVLFCDPDPKLKEIALIDAEIAADELKLAKLKSYLELNQQLTDKSTAVITQFNTRLTDIKTNVDMMERFNKIRIAEKNLGLTINAIDERFKQQQIERESNRSKQYKKKSKRKCIIQ